MEFCRVLFVNWSSFCTNLSCDGMPHNTTFLIYFQFDCSGRITMQKESELRRSLKQIIEISGSFLPEESVAAENWLTRLSVSLVLFGACYLVVVAVVVVV